MEVTEITKEECLTLEKYYDRMFRIVQNQAVIGLDLEMKESIIAILDKYGYMKNLCSKCNSNIIQIMTIGCFLYKNNKGRFDNDIEGTTDSNQEVEVKAPKKRKTKK